jgi:hypothetical protein
MVADDPAQVEPIAKRLAQRARIRLKPGSAS